MPIRLSLLRRHPFPVTAQFDRVLALSFAFPQETLRPLVPPGLELDRYGDWGFATLAMVWTRRLRPAGLPRWMGYDFFLAGYRVFVRMTAPDGRRLRGLRVLRSETDRRSMKLFGNMLTEYRYANVALEAEHEDLRLKLRGTTKPDCWSWAVTADFGDEPGAPPPGSPFPDWRTARQFAGPMPFTFAPCGDGTFVVVEGSRQRWKPRPVRIESWEVGYLRSPPFADAEPVLANAFTVENVPYRWKRGRIVRPGNR